MDAFIPTPSIDLADVIARAPRVANPDTTLHMIVVRHPNGAYVPERNATDLGYAATVKDIVDGQVENIEAVFAFNPVEGWSHNVTEDIAIAIAERLSDFEPVHQFLLDFVEEHAGPEYTAGVRAAERTFAAA